MDTRPRLLIDPQRYCGTISKHLYGYFSEHLGRCIYEGVWVGENSDIPNHQGIRTDVVEALRRLQVPVLRWPGGLFADTYHWKNGIGPLSQRQPIVNVFWGGEVESNQFGTHEYFHLCEQLNCEPYIAFNMGSGSVEEMVQWLEYMTFPGDSPMARLRRSNGRDEPWHLKYVGIGNEAWGGGGRMRPEYYADEFRRYACYCRNFSGERLYKVACGPYGGDTHWTEVLMDRAGDMMDGISLHYYTQREPHRGRALDIDEEFWMDHIALAEKIDDYLSAQDQVMSRYDPRKRVGIVVDEWGASYDEEEGTNPRHLYQQNSIMDAMIACIHLNAFNLHNDRVQMANLAQTVNVIQSVLLTKGALMIKTPTYHVMDLFRPHHQAQRVYSELHSPMFSCGHRTAKALTASVSSKGNGELFMTLGNCDPHHSIALTVETGLPAGSISGRVLTDDDWSAHNTFDKPDRVQPRKLEEGSYGKIPGGFTVTLPSKSVAALTVRLEE